MLPKSLAVLPLNLHLLHSTYISAQEYHSRLYEPGPIKPQAYSTTPMYAAGD